MNTLSEHFKYEEGRLEACHYPELAEHRKKHADLVNNVRELKEKMNSGKHFVTMETKKFLQSWLVEHIQRSDKKYSPYLQQTFGRQIGEIALWKERTNRTVATPAKPVAVRMRSTMRPLSAAKKPVVSTAASDEWEEF
ncbi:MAG: hemerythrin domain-containing protein [Candidatus Competibacter sp.]